MSHFNICTLFENKNSMKLFCFILLSITSVSLSAYDFEVDGLYYNIIDNELWDMDYPTVEVTNCGLIKKDDKPYLQYDEYEMDTIIVPNTVYHDGIEYHVIGLGNMSIYHARNLRSLKLPDGLLYIDDGALSECRRLSSLDIPESVIIIGKEAFEFCTEIKKLVFPEGLEYLGPGCCYSCSSLESVSLPSTIDMIPNKAFNLCKKLTDVKISEGPRSIGYSAFEECVLLEHISLPSSITRIEQGAFAYCYRLSNVGNLDNVRIIGVFAFCLTSVSKVSFAPHVTSIRMAAFTNHSIKTLELNAVDTIGIRAFECSEALQTVRLEGDVKYIMKLAFMNCNRIKDFYCLSCFVPQTDSLAFSQWNIKNAGGLDEKREFVQAVMYSIAEQATLHVPRALIDQYRSTYPWSEFGSIVAIEDEADDIRAIDSSNLPKDNQQSIYNLQGLRTSRPAKGIHIVGGRKVLVK